MPAFLALGGAILRPMVRFRTSASTALFVTFCGLAVQAAQQSTTLAPMPVADPGTPSETRALVLRFTPTDRSQIAIWIEKSDGTFLKTVALTQAVSVRGLGNRPGAAQMNSGYHWPYGRREGALPIWAHRRANAPDVPGQFPRIIFQNRPEGYASRTCEDSTGDDYFCLAFSGNSKKDGLDAVSCPTRFNSDKGRILREQDVAAGYWEPAEIGGQNVRRPLSLTSLYPPRRDVTPCTFDADPVCRAGTVRACLDFPDIARYNELARAAMPDIDAVTTATPPADTEQALMFSVPDTWLPGEYVAWVEVNTEGDYNNTFNEVTHRTPQSADWDSWARDYGYPFRGQPSVVFRVPFRLGVSERYWAAQPEGYGSVDGTDPAPGEMHAMDGAITNDPLAAAGSGADRLRWMPAASYRVELEVRDRDFCQSAAAPGAPGEVRTETFTDPKHSHQWGHLRFVVPPSELPIAKYEVRYSTEQIIPNDPGTFIQGLPAVAAAIKSEALMIPVDRPPGSTVEVDFGGLAPETRYWVGIRAVDVCNRAGPAGVAELTTTKVSYTQLSGCFIATAAYGSAIERQVHAMRQVRDRLHPGSTLFAVATDLYYRSGPAAADALRLSDAARILVRRLLGPVGAAAEVAVDLAARASK
jgi:hypothetical protein